MTTISSQVKNEDLTHHDLMKGVFMTEIFPDPIRNLPEADIPLEGIKAYLSQSETHQINSWNLKIMLICLSILMLLKSV